MTTAQKQQQSVPSPLPCRLRYAILRVIVVLLNSVRERLTNPQTVDTYAASRDMLLRHFTPEKVLVAVDESTTEEALDIPNAHNECFAACFRIASIVHTVCVATTAHSGSGADAKALTAVLSADTIIQLYSMVWRHSESREKPSGDNDAVKRAQFLAAKGTVDIMLAMGYQVLHTLVVYCLVIFISY